MFCSQYSEAFKCAASSDLPRARTGRSAPPCYGGAGTADRMAGRSDRGQVALGTRLSIIDLEGGAQPLRSL